MNLKKHLFILLIAIASISSCKKHETPGPPNNTIKPDTVTKNVDVFVVGDGEAMDGSYSTAYWKNGTVVQLPNMVAATGIALKDTDVYVMGYMYVNNTEVAAYSKNGVATALSTSKSTVAAITISGTDVYVAGSITDAQNNHTVGYWKNGVFTTLSAGTSYADVSGIVILGSDVYVSGTTATDNTFADEAPVYWKNGVLNKLNASASALPAATSGIAVNGSDVYVIGNGPNFTGIYWKNGTPTLITGMSANAIAFNGPDIYVTGATDFEVDDYTGAYRKNGVITHLGNGNPLAIAVNGKDIYVAAVVPISEGGVLFKNGKADSLFNGNAFLPYGMALRPAD